MNMACILRKTLPPTFYLQSHLLRSQMTTLQILTTTLRIQTATLPTKSAYLPHPFHLVKWPHSQNKYQVSLEMSMLQLVPDQSTGWHSRSGRSSTDCSITKTTALALSVSKIVSIGNKSVLPSHKAAISSVYASFTLRNVQTVLVHMEKSFTSGEMAKIQWVGTIALHAKQQPP